jgi:hypothetical protein
MWGRGPTWLCILALVVSIWVEGFEVFAAVLFFYRLGIIKVATATLA